MVGTGTDRWLLLILRTSRDESSTGNWGVFITFISLPFLHLHPHHSDILFNKTTTNQKEYLAQLLIKYACKDEKRPFCLLPYSVCILTDPCGFEMLFRGIKSFSLTLILSARIPPPVTCFPHFLLSKLRYHTIRLQKSGPIVFSHSFLSFCPCPLVLGTVLIKLCTFLFSPFGTTPRSGNLCGCYFEANGIKLSLSVWILPLAFPSPAPNLLYIHFSSL